MYPPLPPTPYHLPYAALPLALVELAIDEGYFQISCDVYNPHGDSPLTHTHKPEGIDIG